MLYATALGPQPKGEKQPVLFYLHSVTQSERQIGRAIDQLCQLNTLRLAAIVPLPSLKPVRQSLWDVEERIKQTRGQIHELIKSARSLIQGDDVPADNKIVYDKEREVLQNLDDIQTEMTGVSTGDSIEESKELGDATLEYRLIRSRYYKDMFFQIIRSIRLKRIEGYQKYDEFIIRRLGSAFGFIEGIEMHFAKIQAEWNAVDRLYLTTTVTILTGEIDRQQKDIKSIMQDIGKLATHVDYIQKNGELILLGILVPYYVIGIFTHIFGCERGSWCTESLYEIHGFSCNFEQLFSFIIFLGLALFCIRSWRKSMRKGPLHNASSQAARIDSNILDRRSES